MKVLPALLALLVCGTVASAQEPTLTDAQKAELAQYFGFGPMEIYKIKTGMSQLKIADLNGDGRNDVAVVNSYQSRIELFYQPDPAAPSPRPPVVEKNEIPSRGNLRVENVSVAYSIASMEIAELTGDGRPDIVFFGEPKEIVILPGKPEGGFGPPDGIRAPEGNPRGGVLACGDFNGDKRTDVALLGAELILLFYQKPAGGLAAPIRVVHNVKQPLLLMRAELNGDGRDDLILSADEDQSGAYALLQESNGNLGPVRRVRIPRIRSITIAPGEKGDDVYSVEAATGHLRHYRWEVDTERATEQDWPQLLYSYPVRSKSKRRPTAVGDINGDQKPDVVALDPESAQAIVFLQNSGGLEPGVAFPGLVKAVDVCIADVDGDGKTDVLTVSPDEKMIGVAHFVDGRLSFPTPLKIEGEPQAVAVGSRRVGDPSNHVAYVTRVERPVPPDEDEKKDAADKPKEGDAKKKPKMKKQPELHIAPFGGDATIVVLGELSDDVAGVRFADVNDDGLNDLLVFVRFAPLRTYLQNAEGGFDAFSGPQTRDGLVNVAAPEGFTLVDVTGDGKPEVVLAQKNLARALRVEKGQWTIVDQYNPEVADAELGGLAALPGPTLGSPTIALYDKKSRDLLVLKRREDKTYGVAKSMPVGAFDLAAMAPLALGANSAAALVLADVQMLAVLMPDENAPTLVEKASFETNMKDAWLGDSVIGDVNHDSVRDVLVIDMRKANIELLTTLPNGDLVSALRFQVFQGKRFRDDTEGGEPREVLCGDVTGDGTDDVVLIVHDRLVVYPGQ